MVLALFAKAAEIGNELFLIVGDTVVESVVAEIGVRNSTSSPYTSF